MTKILTTIQVNLCWEGHCEKGCEIQGGSQEMAVMIG